jgi:hypothetical protein
MAIACPESRHVFPNRRHFAGGLKACDDTINRLLSEVIGASEELKIGSYHRTRKRNDT